MGNKAMIPRMAIPIGNEEIGTALRSLFKSKDADRDNVAEFENDLATYVGSKNVFASNTGRTALYWALQALNLRQGDEIIVPAYTCAIVVEVILRLGLKPVLVDIDPETYNINPEMILKGISSKTKAMIPVHLFGQPCEMAPIMEIATKHNLYVIEDVAQALGTEYNRVKVGIFGDLAIYSFGPGKSMTSGEGGALSVNDKDLVEKVMDIKARWPDPHLGWSLHCMKNIVPMKVFSNYYLYAFIRHYLEQTLDKTDQEILENCRRLLRTKSKTNLSQTIVLARMPLLSAEVARIQLRKLDSFNERRIKNANALTGLLKRSVNYLQLPKMSHGGKNTFTRYPIRILKGSRDKLAKKLLREGIDTGKPYSYVIDLFRSLKVEAPNATIVANSILTIPNHPLLRSSDTLKIADTLHDELRQEKTYKN